MLLNFRNHTPKRTDCGVIKLLRQNLEILVSITVSLSKFVTLENYSHVSR
jgi:hypothetical protein